jgi:hypothetical protein
MLSHMPIPKSAPSKTWVWGRSLAEIARSNPAWDTDVSPVIVVCLQIEVCASGWSLVQRSPIECGVSECDRVFSIMRRSWLTEGPCTVGENLSYTHICDYFILVIINLGYCNFQLLYFLSNYVKIYIEENLQIIPIAKKGDTGYFVWATLSIWPSSELMQLIRWSRDCYKSFSQQRGHLNWKVVLNIRVCVVSGLFCLHVCWTVHVLLGRPRFLLPV